MSDFTYHSSLITPLGFRLRLGLGLLGLREAALQGALLLELLRGQFLVLRALGQEADVDAQQVLRDVEVVRLGHALALEGRVEGAQAVQFDALALADHLHHALHHLLQTALDDAGAIGAVVVVDVLGEALQVECTAHHGLGVPFAVGGRLGVVVAVHLIQDSCHTFSVCVFLGLILKLMISLCVLPSAGGLCRRCKGTKKIAALQISGIDLGRFSARIC